MTSGLIIGGGLALVGIVLWKRATAAKQPTACQQACDAQAKVTGVPAGVCKLACSVFDAPAHLECPAGTQPAIDKRPGTAGGYLQGEVDGTVHIDTTGSGSDLFIRDMVDAATRSETAGWRRVTACVPVQKGPAPAKQGTGTQTAIPPGGAPGFVWVGDHWERAKAPSSPSSPPKNAVMPHMAVSHTL